MMDFGLHLEISEFCRATKFDRHVLTALQTQWQKQYQNCQKTQANKTWQQLLKGKAYIHVSNTELQEYIYKRPCYLWAML